MQAERRWALLAATAMLGAAGLAAMGQPKQVDLTGRLAVPLESIFPAQVGDWKIDPTAVGLPISARELGQRFQMYSQVLERTYVNAQGERVMLSVAYGGDQSGSVQMHRPEVCYQSAGFKVSGQQAYELPLGMQTLPATRLLAQGDSRPEPITYWTLLGDEVIRDKHSFQFAQLTAGLRGRMADGTLVRISTIDADLPRAYAVQTRFVQALYQAVPPQYLARVFGTTR
jgi:EpsI family protein